MMFALTYQNRLRGPGELIRKGLARRHSRRYCRRRTALCAVSRRSRPMHPAKQPTPRHAGGRCSSQAKL